MTLAKYVGSAIARKLENVLGEDKALELAREVLGSLDLPRLRDAGDRLKFGRALAERQGVVAVIGHSIQTQALLHGALDRLRDMGIHTPVP